MKKLVQIQNELKAPKGRRNSFGNYNYRSCEDILEAVKPLLLKYDCTLTIKDEVELIGDRYYVRAVAKLVNNEDNSDFEIVSALARESDSKKGMDESQITGACSSYARKYCLNGMFLIDDTKDADTDEFHKETVKTDKNKENKINEGQKKALLTALQGMKKTEAAFLKYFNEKYSSAFISFDEFEPEDAKLAIKELNEIAEKKAKNVNSNQ